MRGTTNLAIVVTGVASLTGCHTITEDLPSRPSAISGGPGSIPVIVVPVPVQTALPVPSPSPPDAPAPNPNPRPTATPDSGGGGGGGSPTNNTSPVARLNASVYFVECGGVPLPGTSRATTAPVGCRVHLDTTPRDASNAPTNPQGTPRWTYSNPGLISVAGSSPFNPVITAKGPGHVDVFAEVDGVRSNTFGVTSH
jgi:hypothetical protein